jgi:biotin carboxylase
MTQLPRGFLKAILIATAALTTSIPFGSLALAATCASAEQRCIAQSAKKADRVERCRAARQSCETSGVFVGPYSGDRYTLQKTGGVIKSCSQSGLARNRACY